jgi:hypothetical protein
MYIHYITLHYMKTNKQITIDMEIMEKLRQEPNASGLIEQLLREHYSMNGDKKKNLMLQRQIQLKNYSKAAKQMKKEIKLFKIVDDLGIDQFSIRWLRGQEVQPSFMQTRNYKQGREIKTPIENFQKAWEVINKNVELFQKI